LPLLAIPAYHPDTARIKKIWISFRVIF